MAKHTVKVTYEHSQWIVVDAEDYGEAAQRALDLFPIKDKMSTDLHANTIGTYAEVLKVEDNNG